METSVSFIRHGQVYNPKLIYYGRLARFHLSKEGLQQVSLVASIYRSKSIQAVFSSPLLRTRQTARIILKTHNHLKLRISHLLNEVLSPFDGSPSSELDARDWDIYTGSRPEYEQPQDVLKRAQKFVEKIRRTYTGQNVIAATHGDLIAFMILWANSLPITSQRRDRLDSLTGIQDNYPAHASVTTFIYQTNLSDEKPKIMYLKPY
jgi:broad specificity phosphatase PhoE